MNNLKNIKRARGSEENSAAFWAAVRPHHRIKRGVPIKYGRMERDASRSLGARLCPETAVPEYKKMFTFSLECALENPCNSDLPKNPAPISKSTPVSSPTDPGPSNPVAPPVSPQRPHHIEPAISGAPLGRHTKRATPTSFTQRLTKVGRQCEPINPESPLQLGHRPRFRPQWRQCSSRCKVILL